MQDQSDVFAKGLVVRKPCERWIKLCNKGEELGLYCANYEVNGLLGYFHKK